MQYLENYKNKNYTTFLSYEVVCLKIANYLSDKLSFDSRDI